MLKQVVKLIGGLIMLLCSIYLLFLFSLFTAFRSDVKRTLKELKPKPNITHLELCHFKGGNFASSHEVYLDEQNISGKIEELTIEELLDLCSTYIKQNRIPQESIRSITFCKSCILLPNNPDRRYPEVIDKKKQELIVGFSFNMALDSLPLTEQIMDITFWKNGRNQRYLNNYGSNEFVEIEPIRQYPLSHFYEKYVGIFENRKIRKRARN